MNPFSENFWLKVAIVPSSDYFEGFWNEISAAFQLKLPVIATLQQFTEDVKNLTFTNEEPSFKVTIYDEEVTIIDFSMYNDYRSYIHDWIVYSTWFFFLLRTWKKLPKKVK